MRASALPDPCSPTTRPPKGLSRIVVVVIAVIVAAVVVVVAIAVVAIVNVLVIVVIVVVFRHHRHPRRRRHQRRPRRRHHHHHRHRRHRRACGPALRGRSAPRPRQQRRRGWWRRAALTLTPQGVACPACGAPFAGRRWLTATAWLAAAARGPTAVSNTPGTPAHSPPRGREAQGRRGADVVLVAWGSAGRV